MGFSAAASRAEAPQGNETDVTQADVDFSGEASTQDHPHRLRPVPVGGRGGPERRPEPLLA